MLKKNLVFSQKMGTGGNKPEPSQDEKKLLFSMDKIVNFESHLVYFIYLISIDSKHI